MSVEVTLKVSAKSNPNAVAGALAAALREREHSELQAVGAGAINQAIKAVAIARSYLRGAQLDLVCTPSFVVVAIGENERTAISLFVERRKLDPTLSHNAKISDNSTVSDNAKLPENAQVSPSEG